MAKSVGRTCRGKAGCPVGYKEGPLDGILSCTLSFPLPSSTGSSFCSTRQKDGAGVWWCQLAWGPFTGGHRHQPWPQGLCSWLGPHQPLLLLSILEL